MKITRDQPTNDPDLMMQLIELFELYNVPEDARARYLGMIESEGIEMVIEYVIRDVPDGFSRGRYLQKDIQRYLDRKGCERS